MKILIIQQKMIGDVLTSTVLCEQLKKNTPKSRVHYLINCHTEAVVTSNPYIDHIIFFKDEYRNSKRSFYQFLKEISKENYDVVIDAYGKLESNLISLFANAKYKITFRKWYSQFIYTHTIVPKKIQEYGMGLAIENRLRLLKPILSETITRINPPKIYLDRQEIKTAEVFLQNHGIKHTNKIIMLSILGSGKKKTYPHYYMAEVIDQIALNSNAVLLFNYIPAQSTEAKALYNLCNVETQKKIAFNCFAPSLRGFLGILYHCHALIGNEGGAVNMAKALGISTFAIFSPWIKKESWHIFSIKKENSAVHLKDYVPEVIEGKSRKELNKKSLELYKLFKPAYFMQDLKSFLKAKSVADQ